ncbi:NAD(P)-binding protein [Mollisia scopiformis]|uniref:NAD(P)-binding protein n=1 Tax=Mollisia scopiformis TaxID=149040 RepID=A0A194X4E3_MOLSC|nr:NAD(P)-binding protein [Mollisia scopiformis]KUJ15050.1 NAD(P)-binding protein [Mollisia scopiformis]
MTTLRLREQDLEGKVAVITGATRGIGRAIAMNLASRGASILGTCSHASSLDLIANMRDEIDALYKEANQERTCRTTGLAANITSPTCAEDIVKKILDLRYGVDIFVNNAADSLPGGIGDLTVNEIQKSMISNIQTPVLIVDEFVKRKMFRPESRIIYISSIRSRQPWSEQLMYAAGKSAGESLCRTWSMAFGGNEEKFSFMAGTTANSVSVGLTQTDSVMQCPPDALEKFKQEFIPLQSIPRFGQPDDVADVVGMLCSRDTRWITGCVLSASGGGIKIG